MILSYLLTPYSLFLLPIFFYLLPYIRARTIRGVPGPPLAAFSNLWLMYQCRRGRRYLAVDNAHKNYGPLVRIQPNHVSIADADALPVIYSHTGGWVKRCAIHLHCCPIWTVISVRYRRHIAELMKFETSNYYDAFVSIQRGLFNTRDRAEHTRKRKTISHTFSAKSVAQFEVYIHRNLKELVKQWTRISENAMKSGQAFAGLDSLQWFNFLAFDIIGDLVSRIATQTMRGC